MLTNKDIMLTVDYHDENLVIRRLDGSTGEERLFGVDRLKRSSWPRSDKLVLSVKLAELEHLETLIAPVEKEIVRFYGYLPAAQRPDEIRGIGPVSAVSILARIGQISRFPDDNQLIGFAGLAPGVRSSDQTKHTGHIGGGGTDKHLRHYLIEASVWARQVPRYRSTYERVMHKRGKKIARLVVSRMMLRSIYKMLQREYSF